MPRAVVILPSTTYRAADFVAAAESLGVDLVVASEQPPPFDMGDRYLQVDCSDPEAAAAAIVEIGDEAPIDGVVAADDRGVLIAAITGETLGLVSNTPEAAAATRDKLLMRRRLDAAEVPQPPFREISPDGDPASQLEGLDYPLVVKPVDRSAGQGVLRVDSPAELGEVIARIRHIVDDGQAPLIAEEYLPGVEISIEGLLRHGRLTVLAVFDKPDTPTGPAFPETILVTPSRLPDEDRVESVRVAESALRGLGLTQGPVHIELKVHEGRARVIEIAGRSIGGLCSRSLSFGLMNATLETLILRNALAMDKPELRREPHASGVLMIPIHTGGTLRQVRGLDEARAIDEVTGIDLTISPGTRVLPPPEGDRYLGFVFARALDPAAVETALRKASAALEAVID